MPEVLDASGGSSVTTSFSRRGTVKKAGSSYGSLITSIERTADGLVKQLVYGDAADTRTAYLYDERRRISSVQTYRGPPTSGAANWSGQFPVSSNATADEPTRQLVLQDEDFRYDVVGNPVEIRDWRDPQDWPDGAKPVTKKITYDDLYRAVDVRYEYASGDDDWTSPFAAEVDASPDNEDDRRAQPSPHVEFEKRLLRQTFEYDWLGNNETTTDDAGGFYDRSLGEIENGAPAGAEAGSDEKPYQLKGASLSEGHSPGSLEARYDDAGYMTGMVVQRGGPCLVPGVALSSPEACNQRYVYEWDEVGRLSRARRWDNNTTAVDDAELPSGKPAADLRYNYDASDQRVLKEAVDQNDKKSFTVYVFPALELRRAQWSDDPEHTGNDTGDFDYEANEWTVVPYLLANGVRLARVAYEPDAPKILESETSEDERGYVSQHEAAGGSLHVLFELGDHLGSTSVVLDKATGELVERSTFQAYGGSESDYRPERWGAFREDYRFTGKEEDAEVGLQYFGKRYLNPLLGRWISADPLAVHAPGEADLNLYAYVSGAVLKNVDPLGLEDETSYSMFSIGGAASLDEAMSAVDSIEADFDAEAAAASTGQNAERPMYSQSSPEPDRTERIASLDGNDRDGDEPRSSEELRQELGVPASDPFESVDALMSTLSPALAQDSRSTRVRRFGGNEFEMGFIIVETEDGFSLQGPLVAQGDEGGTGVFISLGARASAGPVVETDNGPRATLVGGTEDGPMSVGIIHGVVHTHPDRNLITGTEPSRSDLVNAATNAASGMPHAFIVPENENQSLMSYDSSGITP